MENLIAIEKFLIDPSRLPRKNSPALKKGVEEVYDVDDLIRMAVFLPEQLSTKEVEDANGLHGSQAQQKARRPVVEKRIIYVYP